jgi:hypothetical protein
MKTPTADLLSIDEFPMTNKILGGAKMRRKMWKQLLSSLKYIVEKKQDDFPRGRDNAIYSRPKLTLSGFNGFSIRIVLYVQ